MAEVARRASAGIPAELPDAEDDEEEDTGIDVESITGGASDDKTNSTQATDVPANSTD